MGLLSTLAHFTILKRNSWKYIWFLSLRKRIKIKSFENHSTGLAICPKDVNLFETLEKSFEINFETYELHKKEQKNSVCSQKRMDFGSYRRETQLNRSSIINWWSN
jgi:hydroxymethylglutaryl-CoA synthase